MVRYLDAGVRLDAAEAISAHAAGRLGRALFGGFVSVPALCTYRSPVLVASMDGIGTKVRLAAHLDRLEGLGQDIVHHCVNDIAVHGAQPLLFLDYLAFHTLVPATAMRLIDSIAAACRTLGIELAGGETAEMPQVYSPGEFDVAGAIVGVAEEEAVVDGRTISSGDRLIGLAAVGPHTNGFSLLQTVFGPDDYDRTDLLPGQSLGDALLAPHRCYLHEIEALLAGGSVHGLAHITGGGIAGNLARIVPAGLVAEVSLPSMPALYRLLAARGVPGDELYRVFNLGIGLIAVCAAGSVAAGWVPLGFVRPAEAGDEGRVMLHDCD